MLIAALEMQIELLGATHLRACLKSLRGLCRMGLGMQNHIPAT